MLSVCFVCATKDRPVDLRRMLTSLADQTRPPDRVIVVDSSGTPVHSVVNEFTEKMRIEYVHHWPPSASAQRNVGVKMALSDADLIGFIDDDAVLELDALEKMLEVWNQAPSDLGGCSFNMENHPVQAFPSVKRSWLPNAIGLYDSEAGRVAPSGWQSMIGVVSRTTYVDWLPSGAVLWRSEVLRQCRFDEYFDRYSYLEDLDLSFTARRNWKLAVAADALYNHYPSPARHSSSYSFGRTEVKNRLYFVDKHGLSQPRCWLGLALRMGSTACEGLFHRDSDAFSRVFGNLTEMAAQLKFFGSSRRTLRNA